MFPCHTPPSTHASNGSNDKNVGTREDMKKVDKPVDRTRRALARSGNLSKDDILSIVKPVATPNIPDQNIFERGVSSDKIVRPDPLISDSAMPRLRAKTMIINTSAAMLTPTIIVENGPSACVSFTIAMAEAGERAIMIVLIRRPTATFEARFIPDAKGMRLEKMRIMAKENMKVAPMKPVSTHIMGLMNLCSLELFSSIPAAKAMQDIENWSIIRRSLVVS
mmetsp:Transcript_2778/g.4202  ORF Transcript_2778/g.4202 Transcript_2778/m.4202 type:complete len:222 (+) Transcript_2778:18-683(+)